MSEQKKSAVCDECGSVTLKKNLYAHQRDVHGRKVDLIRLPKKAKKAMCTMCGKKLATQYGLSRHIKVVHGIALADKNTSRIKCSECLQNFTSYKMLRDHLQEHGKEFHCEKLTFKSSEG
jgi:DNA-directed RNA polymerase subunit RPC12/RpoP